MPWRGAEYAGEFPSLGWDVLDWISANLRVPDGQHAGEPLEFTDEQATLLVRWYGVDDRGRWLFRRGSKRAAQGWGKSPFLGAVALAELAGPTRFDGWSAAGEPVAIEPSTPWVQVAAVSEDQTDNTFAAAYAMAVDSDLADRVLDIGITRMHLIREPTSRLEPVTASAGSRLGQRITFAVLDETHLWLRKNGGHKLAATIRRNASKMGGRTFESTNAFEVGQDSVAERTDKAHREGAPGLLYDAVEAPDVEDLKNRRKVIAALKVAYGDSAMPTGWVNLERLADEIADPGTDPDDARRFYFNQCRTASSRPVDLARWAQLADPHGLPDEGELVALGFDGSINNDSTALYGCTGDGYIFEIACWERPEDAPLTWRVPRLEVHATVEQAFGYWNVGLMFMDPPKWWTELEQWQQRFGDQRVVAFDTNQSTVFAPACDRFTTGVREGTTTHDARPGLTDHLAASAKQSVRLSADEEDGRSRFVIVKADTRKIDRAVAAIAAHEAAMTMQEVPAVSLHVF